MPAIVTGASRGIGRAVATDLAKTHQVIGTYRGRLDAAESLQAETGAGIFPCDISSAADRQALIAHARERLGRPSPSREAISGRRKGEARLPSMGLR